MRYEQWPELLDQYVIDNQRKPYKYGTADCVTFMAGLVALITGKDVLKGKRYSGEKSALKLLKKHGGLYNLVDIQFEKVGFKKIDVMRARRGDVVGFKTEAHGETVGVCVGNMFVSQGSDGLVFLPMRKSELAWEVK
jgi:hypothetical protein